MLIVVALLAASNLDPTRLGAIVVIHLVQFLHASSLHRRLQRSNVQDAMQALKRSRLVGGVVGIVIAQGAVVALTGGLTSPMTPLFVGPVIVAMTLFGRTRASAIVAATAALVIAAVALLPPSLRPTIQEPWYTLLSLTTICVSIATASLAVMGLSDGLAHTGQRLRTACDGVLEAQFTKKRDLDGMGAKVAHELKNPLAAIKGLLQLERARVVDERSRRRFEVMAKEVSRMEAILHDYLSFARPFEALQPTDVDLKSIVENVVAVLEGRATSAKVGLRVEAQTVTVRIDPVRMKEALLNLASNAVEATGAGGTVTLRVAVDAGVVSVSVADTGVGMSEPVLARLGTPFFTTRDDGTGLGVALARSIVAQHGGELSFESIPARGTTARIALPDFLVTDGGVHGHGPSGR
jgi:signal transduction histidine kinase